MGRLRYLTAGESHGPALVVVVEGLPAGLEVTAGALERELARRRAGFGRGARMKLEADELEIIGGVRHGRTLGSPVAVVVRNTEFEKKWSEAMSPRAVPDPPPPLTRPRPGHADLVGMLKYGHRDARNVLERASARETAARTVAGTLARLLLEEIGVCITSHVVAIGGVRAKDVLPVPGDRERIEASPVRCLDPEAEEGMVRAIEAARAEGDTLGGVFEVVAFGVPPGLGSYVHWDRKIDGRLAQALLSINAMKAVAVGDGFSAGDVRGSEAHDEILWEEGRGYYRPTNRAGGVEGGVTTGDPLRVRVVMKPLSTLRRPLRTVDVETKQEQVAIVERTDTCAVPSACVIGEAVCAFVLADAALEKFGGDAVDEFVAAHGRWLERLQRA